MGMFDYLNFEGKEYQTKDTPRQGMDRYEIRGDELWWKKCKYEWVENESLFGGVLKEVSHEWLFCDKFDGVIDFYREDKENGGYEANAWEEWHTLFSDGKLLKIEKKQ